MRSTVEGFIIRKDAADMTNDIYDRISEMEQRLVRIKKWLDGGVTDGSIRKDAQLLDDYYRSPQWRSDFEADEAGMLPQDMPRGVLSEDGIYNVLEEYYGRCPRAMTYEEAVAAVPAGRYRHFKGNEYEVIGIAGNSETEEPMVVYRALYGEGRLWVRPASMWNETVERDGRVYKRFERVE